MNCVELIGRLTRDPEMNEPKQGETMRTKFSVAIDKVGTEGTDFINCVTFGKSAENVSKYCKKGSLVAVEGSLSSYSFENQDGERISGLNVNARRVQFLSKPSENKDTPKAQTKTEERAEEQQLLQQAMTDYEDDSTLPF